MINIVSKDIAAIVSTTVGALHGNEKTPHYCMKCSKKISDKARNTISLQTISIIIWSWLILTGQLLKDVKCH